MNKDPVTYNNAKLRRFHDTWLEKSSNALEEKKKASCRFLFVERTQQEHPNCLPEEYPLRHTRLHRVTQLGSDLFR